VPARAGVLGRPISHSLSPVLHRAAYAALGLDWTYDAVDCGVDDLPAVLAARADWAGFSATMPLKHALLDVAAIVRPTAADIGAANTLLPGPEGWIADNTDVAGIVAALRAAGVAPTTVTVLGAGGTAQAALAALRTLEVGEVSVLVRDRSRSFALLGTAERLGVAVSLGDLSTDAAALDASLVISTLPPGAADPLAERSWSPRQAVLDVVYVPWPTALAAQASAAGATVVSGAAMLLQQAAEQVRLMTGRDAPVEAMRAALLAAAPGCGG
jgi:shikimate dehydrogenase